MTKAEIQELFPHGDVMTIDEFIKCVDSGVFIPYDGYGHYFDEKRKKETREHTSFDVNVLRQETKKYGHVVWYNK